jgi:hypothetical protein
MKLRITHCANAIGATLHIPIHEQVHLVCLVRLVRSQMDTFSLFLRKQTDKRQISVCM